MRHFVIVILDSVGYEVFRKAKESEWFIKNARKFKKVYSTANFTIPSMLSYMMSYFPIGLKNEDYDIPFTPPEILPEGFKKLGYRTVFITSNPFMELIDNAYKREWDEYITLEKKNSLPEMIEIALNRMKQGKHFVMLHVMETHIPYYDGKEEYPKIYNYKDETIKEIDKKKMKAHHVRSVNYSLSLLKEFIRQICNATIIITADHGELYPKGHAPNVIDWNPKIFEIPYLVIER